MFSTITPIKNNEVVLGRALGSTKSKEIVERIVVTDTEKDLPVHPEADVWLSNGRNLGPGVARDKGVLAAKGEYLLYLDADDELISEGVDDLARYIESQEATKPDLVVFDSEFVALDGSYIEQRKDMHLFKQSKNDLLRDFLELRVRQECMFFAIKKQFLLQNNIKFRNGIHEDVDYIFEMLKRARTIRVLDRPVYRKFQNPGQITSKFTLEHLNGFISAFQRIWDIVDDDPYLLASKKTSTRNLFASLSAKCALSNREDLLEKLADLSPKWDFKDTTNSGEGLTLYERRANEFRSYIETKNFKLFQQKSREIITKQLSCNDLQDSLFLRPNEVRTCCRRFFKSGERKGDIKLFDVNCDGDLTLEKVFKAKKELQYNISTGKSTGCDECPFLEFKEEFKREIREIKNVSMEEHTICNMRCTYCSEDYFGGEKPKYNMVKFLDELNEKGLAKKISRIVWGGGEPTAGKEFEKTISFFEEKAPQAHHRIVTNSVLYSDVVDKLLQRGQMQFTTSVDAGTPSTFSKIRGFRQSGFDKVLKNIQKYSEAARDAITIKYLFSFENWHIDEIKGFLDSVRFYKLNNSIFQISVNFKFEVIEEHILKSMLYLFGGLHKLKVKAVFLDEIILQRFSELNAERIYSLVEEVENDLEHKFYHRSSKDQKIALWGASFNADNLLKNSRFFKEISPVCLFDSDIRKQGKTFSGLQVKAFDPLKYSDVKILICSVQGYAKVLEGLKNYGISEENIVKELIL